MTNGHHRIYTTLTDATISSGEALAFAGAILGHSNMRSTAIYAHVQHDPARQVADRIAEKIAAALAGISAEELNEAPIDEDESLLRRVAEILAGGGPEADRLRIVISALAV